MSKDDDGRIALAGSGYGYGGVDVPTDSHNQAVNCSYALIGGGEHCVVECDAGVAWGRFLHLDGTKLGEVALRVWFEVSQRDDGFWYARLPDALGGDVEPPICGLGPDEISAVLEAQAALFLWLAQQRREMRQVHARAKRKGGDGGNE